MRLAQTIGEGIFTLMFISWIYAEAIRLLAPRYHARMLARIKEGRVR